MSEREAEGWLASTHLKCRGQKVGVVLEHIVSNSVGEGDATNVLVQVVVVVVCVSEVCENPEQSGLKAGG